MTLALTLADLIENPPEEYEEDDAERFAVDDGDAWLIAGLRNLS